MLRKYLAVLFAVYFLFAPCLTALSEAGMEPTEAPAVTLEEPAEEPEPPASDPTTEAKPTDTPEPTMEPEASAAPEPTHTPEPSVVPEPSQSLEATASPEGEASGEPLPTPAPLFERGYARVVAGTPVYTEEALQEKLGELSDACVVYAHGRRAAGDGLPDLLAIAFATADGVVSGFVQAEATKPLTDEALEAYLAKLDTDWAWDDRYPLEQVAFEPNLAGEPAPEEATESPTPTPEVTTEPPPSGEDPTEDPAPQPVLSIIAEPSPLVIGETVTLRAMPENLPAASWQWQVSADGVAWTDIECADGPAYSFVSGEANAAYLYRVLWTELPGQPVNRLLAEGGEPDLKAKDDPTEETTLASPPLTLLVKGLGVAKILSTGRFYLTLPEAVAAATSGDTIELVHDTNLTQPITLYNTLSLVASGDRRITGRGDHWMFYVNMGGNLKLGESGGELTIDAHSGEAADHRCVFVNGGGTLRLYDQATLTGGYAEHGGGGVSEGNDVHGRRDGGWQHRYGGWRRHLCILWRSTVHDRRSNPRQFRRRPWRRVVSRWQC